MMKKTRFLTFVVVIVFIMTLSAICLAQESYTTNFDETTGTYTISGTGTAPRPVADSTIKKLVVEDGITVLSGSGPSLGCTNCTVVELPDSLTDITAAWCFYGWTGLTDITIPKNVKTISDNTFYDCTSLKTVTIEGTVETIPSSMFVNCSNLETVWLAEGVKNISRTAFYNCKALQNVYFPSTVESISSNAFLQANSSVTIHGTKGSYVESWCNENGYTFSAVTPAVTPTVSLICEDYVDSENNFDVYISVTENTNICGGRMTIGYDNTVLEIVSVSKESLLSGVSVLTNLAYTESSARISLAGVKNITSGGNLLKVTFKAKTTYENIDTAIFIQEMKFSDYDENSIFCAQENASVLIKAKSLPSFSVECPQEALIGSVIDVKVNITENSGAFGGRFDLVYDNTKLQLVSNEVGSIFSNATPITNSNYTNKLRLTWAGTSEMIEGGTLLTATFKVLEVPGEAIFSLENYRMRGDNDNSIEVSAIGNSVNAVTELVCSTQTTYIEDNGQWKFTSTIKNCLETAVIFVALYDENRLIDISEITDISNDISKDLYVKKCDFDIAKVFIWESSETLKPISHIEEILYE